MSDTPKTDAQAYDCEYRGDMGGKFTADAGKIYPYGDHVSADFARTLETEIAELNERLIDRQQTLMETLIENQNLRRELDKAMHYNQ